MTITIGKYTYGTPNIHPHGIANPADLIIGKFCSIAENVNIFLGHNHRTDWVSTYPFGHINQHVFNRFNGHGHPSTKGNVVIGNDVWIASGVTIMSGVKIGDGAVIAGNSHVIKDVEPYTIVGGNPAKFIKKRFTDSQINDLLEIKWWDFEDYKINELSPLLCNDSIEVFLKAAKS